MTAFSDDFTGAAGPLQGRVSATGHVWRVLNDNAVLDGAGRYTRDPAKPAGGATGGCYSQIELDAPVTSMTAQVSWLGTSPDSAHATSFGLICSAADTHNGAYPQLHVFDDMVHIAISPWAIGASTYTGGTPGPGMTFAYPGGLLALDGTVYTIGLEFRGQIVTIKGPNGADYKIAGPLYDAYRGPYLDFQCYDTPKPDLGTRFESVAATTVPLAGYIPPLPLPAALGAETEPR